MCNHEKRERDNMCVSYQIYMRQMNIYKKGIVFGERIYPVIAIFYLKTYCLNISSKDKYH